MIQGNNEHAALSGQVKLQDSVIDIALPLPSSAIPSVLPIFSPPLCTVNCGITIEEPLYIVGKGIHSLWKGEIEVKGSLQELNAFGNITCTKGTFIFADKSFSVNKGKLTFTGNIWSQSSLNIEATTSNEPSSTQLIVYGSLENPECTMESKNSIESISHSHNNALNLEI